MLKIDRATGSLARLENPSMQQAGIREREHLQALIRDNPAVFFSEIDEDLLLLGEEVFPSEDVDNRIDLLAVDRTGTLVIIELKRGSDRYQLLQALGYAALIASWSAEDLIGRRSRFTGIGPEEVKEQIDRFLDGGLESSNASQRVLLIAESFPYEVLATTEWLVERYGLDMRCVHVALVACDGSTLLSCNPVYPVGDVKAAAARRRRRGPTAVHWTNWADALADIENDSVRNFFAEEAQAGREGNLDRRMVGYRVEGRRRWWVGARRKHAYVWQGGRFDEDLAYWKERLSRPDDVGVIDNGNSLRIMLASDADFAAFRKAVKELADTSWIERARADDETPMTEPE